MNDSEKAAAYDEMLEQLANVIAWRLTCAEEAFFEKRKHAEKHFHGTVLLLEFIKTGKQSP